MQCKPSKSELTRTNVSVHAHHFARTACRTLILDSSIFTKQEQDTAGQFAGRSSIVENGSRTLQDTCRTTCRTLAYRKKWEQDVAELCWTPAEQLAGRSSIAKKKGAGHCRTLARQLAGRSPIVKNGSRTLQDSAGHLQNSLQDIHVL